MGRTGKIAIPKPDEPQPWLGVGRRFEWRAIRWPCKLVSDALARRREPGCTQTWPPLQVPVRSGGPDAAMAGSGALL